MHPVVPVMDTHVVMGGINVRVFFSIHSTHQIRRLEKLRKDPSRCTYQGHRGMDASGTRS